MLYSEFFSPLTFGLQRFSLLSRPYRELAKEYYNTYYICALPDTKVIPFTLEMLESGLLKSKYKNVKTYACKKSVFMKAWDIVNDSSIKILTKIKNIFSPDNKGICIQNRKYPISFNNQTFEIRNLQLKEKENV